MAYSSDHTTGIVIAVVIALLALVAVVYLAMAYGQPETVPNDDNDVEIDVDLPSSEGGVQY